MPLHTDHAVQEFAKNAPVPKRPGTENKSLELPPELMALLGAGADAASTFNFMKQGEPKTGLQWGAQAPSVHEDNALFSGHGPGATALGVLGSSLGQLGLSKLLKRKAPGMANAMMANQGAESIGLAAENFSAPTKRKESASDALNGKVTAAIRRKK